MAHPATHPSRAALGLLAASLLACQPSPDAQPLELSLEPGPEHTPLGAVLRVELQQAGELRVTVDDGERDWQKRVQLEPDEETDVKLLGLHFDRHHLITLQLCDEVGDCRELDSGLEYRTPARPAELPPIRVLHGEPERMEPGWTLLTLLPNHSDQGERFWSALVAVDEQGTIVWYHRVDNSLGDHELGRDSLVYSVSNLHMDEVDPLGTRLNRWAATEHVGSDLFPEAIPVDAETFHHELLTIDTGLDPDSGNTDGFLTLGSELRELPDYPSDEVSLEPARDTTQVIGDVIVEFTRKGEVVRRWPLLDILDPYRLSYNSLGAFWTPVYGEDTRDWSHGNGVALTPEGDAYVVSLRHQDALVSVDRSSGELGWILGDPARWQSPFSEHLLDCAWQRPGADPGTGEFSYHQHAPVFTAAGNLLVFDNGNGRAIPPAEPLAPAARYSRAVEYAIDSATRQCEQVWSFDGRQHGIYSRFVGDANELPTTGNVLVVSGGQEDKAADTGHARILEVTHEDDPEVVFDLQVGDPEAPSGTKWVVYRAERMQPWH